jgi:hypothetical protein
LIASGVTIAIRPAGIVASRVAGFTLLKQSNFQSQPERSAGDGHLIGAPRGSDFETDLTRDNITNRNKRM